jgi:putative protease
MSKLELLAPARDFDGGRAAVDYGADALYVGGASFGARAAAGNTAREISRLVDYARRFGVRVYATLNTLLLDSEMERAEHTARELIAAGVDALIVQDMAFRRLRLEGIEFHASTQMCNAEPEDVAFLTHAGFTRAVLERGLTLDEIRAIRAATDIELECFVHGAICVGFSGRCYLSRSMGPRSGNRGDCMQACRLPYDLLEDGRPVQSGRHFLSPLDLDLSQRLSDLADAGVTSFKIEGRLKDNAYVKNIVSLYRQKLDELGRPKASSGRVEHDFVPDPRRSFSRGATQWMLGNRRGLANFDTPKATGALIGRVERVGESDFTLPAPHYPPLRAGDGICFAGGGTYINAVDGNTVTPDKMDGIAAGVSVYRNYDKAFDDTLAASRTRRVIDVRAVFEGDRLTLVDSDGFTATAHTAAAQPARDPAKAAETLRTQLAKTGDTIFNIMDVEIVGAAPFMPIAAANTLRRAATDALLAARLAAPPVRHTAAEEVHYPFARPVHNVTNRLAEQFWHDHGVAVFEPPLELKDDLRGRRVLVSAYCLRRELGRCGKPMGELRLRHGTHTYRLDFDCNKCRMTMIKI